MSIRKIILSRKNVMPSYIADGRGFTIIELLVAIGLLSIVIAIVWAVFNPFQQGYIRQQVSSDVLQKSRSALNYLSDEIRLAGLDPTESGNFGIERATDNHLSISFDTRTDAEDFNGTVDLGIASRPEIKNFRFIYNNHSKKWCLEELDNIYWNSVEYEAIDEDRILIPDLDMPTTRFVYYNAERGQLLTPVPDENLADIRYISLEINVKEPAGGNKTVSKWLQTKILCRNLYFNAQQN